MEAEAVAPASRRAGEVGRGLKSYARQGQPQARAWRVGDTAAAAVVGRSEGDQRAVGPSLLHHCPRETLCSTPHLCPLRVKLAVSIRSLVVTPVITLDVVLY